MTGVSPRFTTLTLCLFLSWPLSASAQTPAPITNADIVKLIQAGLPESAIINKIQANPGAFDTSTDALIALKKAGATDGELAAITAAPPAPAPMPMPTVAAAPPAPVEAFGGQLLRTKYGDPYVQFPAVTQDVFPDGRLTNTASLVIYQGEPAILIPSTEAEADPGFPRGHVIPTAAVGNLIFTKSGVFFDTYIYGAFSEAKEVQTPGDLIIANLSKADQRRAATDPAFRTEKVSAGLHGRQLYSVQLPLVFHEFPSWWYGRLTVAGPPESKPDVKANKPYFMIGVFHGPTQKGHNSSSDDSTLRSGQLQLFVGDLQKDFNAVLSSFEKASGISDPAQQLSPYAHYRGVGESLAQKYKVLLTQRLEETSKTGGGGWLASLNQLNNAVSLGSGLKTMGSGLANGSGSAMQAGLQTTTASANAMAATGTQAQYAANAQMQASLAQSNAAYAQNAAGSQYAAATPATATTTTGTAASTTGTTRPPAIGAQAPQPPTTATLTITLIGPGRVTSQPAGINCPGVCSFTWPVNYTQQLYLTVTPPAGYLDNNECTGTAPITPGKATTCLLGGVAGTRNITVCTYKAGTPNPCP